LQPGPQKELNQSNWVLGSSGKRSQGASAKFRRPEAAAVELNYGGRVPVRGFTGGGPEVGGKPQGNKAVQLVTLARVEVVEEVDSHGRPRGRRRGQWQR
jgi:hypothetical protein